MNAIDDGYIPVELYACRRNGTQGAGRGRRIRAVDHAGGSSDGGGGDDEENEDVNGNANENDAAIQNATLVQ